MTLRGSGDISKIVDDMGYFGYAPLHISGDHLQYSLNE